MTSKSKPNGQAATNGAAAAVEEAPERDGIPESSNGAAHREIPVPPEKRCIYKTQRGTPCRAPRRKDSNHCIFHDEDFQEERIRMRVGRHFFRLRHTADTPEGIHELLRQTIEAVANGQISPRQGNSMIYGAQTMMVNQPRLRAARTHFNVEEDANLQMAKIIVSEQLDKIENEIEDAREGALPIPAARAHAAQVRTAPPEKPRETAEQIAKRLGIYAKPAASEPVGENEE